MLLTPWGERLDRAHPLPEYPRPQMVRDSYLNLNGAWEYAMTADDRLPAQWDGTILVPFSPEAELSGVKRTLHAGETLWYRRVFRLPDGFCKGRVLLHFGAVDQEAQVTVNGREAACHHGGYTAFTVDITEDLAEENTLVVRVHDDTDASEHSRGKQSSKPGGIWYTAQSGIWQTVWLESVPLVYVRELLIRPLTARDEVALTVLCDEPVRCTAELDGQTVAFHANEECLVHLDKPHLWSPDDPYLYPVTVTAGEDRIESYFAMRCVCVRADEHGVKRLFLNGAPLFQTGLLDQGYWPDGLYTAPADEAMIFDIQTAKDMGFNMLRKHIKIEPMRWYYHCDRLGMLVWQDMMNGGGKYKTSTISFPLFTGRSHRDGNYHRFARENGLCREEYRAELSEMVSQLRNVPCIVVWVPFNEGWGQFDAADAVRRITALDPDRLIDHASGWHDQGIGELESLHVYFKRYRYRPDRLGRAVVLSEFGGYALALAGHTWQEKDFGYKKFADEDALQKGVTSLYEEQILPAAVSGLCATVYTQLSDVEEEVNGIVTYDRRVVKLDAAEMRRLNKRLTAKE